RELGARDLLRREHHDGKTEPASGPCRGRSVVAGRRRDDSGRAALAEALERRQRAPPLEGAELVSVLPLQPRLAPGGQRWVSELERCGGGDRGRPAGHDIATLDVVGGGLCPPPPPPVSPAVRPGHGLSPRKSSTG